MRRFLLIAAVVLFPLAVFGGDGQIKKASEAIPDQYIVVLEDFVDDVPGAAAILGKMHGGEVGYVYGAALNGFSVRIPAQAASGLAHDPWVKYVEEDGVMSADTTQSGATWGIDRIDQRNRPLSGTYTYIA